MKNAVAVLLAAILVAITVIPVTVSAQTASDILEDNGLPVVNITIDESAEGYGTIEEMNASPDHSVECTGSVKITVPEGYTGDYSDTVLSDTKDLKLDYIRGRGNTTWLSDKKPYKLKLDKKTDLLGMGKNKHWVLLANAMDTTLLRNRLVSYMGRELGLPYTPKMLPVDVVMNGEYLGSYYLSEQVRVGENRVDIDELTSDDNGEPEITGGYLLAYKPYETEPENNRFTTENGCEFQFENPDFYSDEAGTPEQKAYITDYLQKTENAVYSGNADEYMDLQSAADYWWIQAFTLNIDAFFTDSTYLYKPRNDKLYWGPLWDFDLSLGKSYTETEGFNLREMPWLDYLRENDEEYLSLLLERWNALDGIITDILKDGGVLDSYIAEIRNSWEDNLSFSKNSYDDYELETETLRTWITERQAWINENLGLLSKVHSTVTFTIDGEVVEQYTISTGKQLTNVPTAPEKENEVFLGWEYEGEYLNAEWGYPAIWDDAVITAVYVSEDEITKPDHLFFESYDVWRVLSEYDYNNIYYSSFLLVPEDAQDKRMTWTSSDTSVATVDENGVVSFFKTGEAVITAELTTGLTRSYTLHIYDENVTHETEAEKIVVENPIIRMKVGEYAQIMATIQPQPSFSDISAEIESGDDVVEEIDFLVYKALAPGTATVTLLADDIVMTCTIIVTDGEEATEEPTELTTAVEEATQKPTEAPTVPIQSATNAVSSTTDETARVNGGSVATGESNAALVVLFIIISATGMIAYYSYRKRRLK